MSYRKFQILRGDKADLPTLSDGEMAFCNDTKELYIGSGGTNRRIGDSETAYGVATGTNNYVVTVDKQLSGYTAGLVVNFLVQNANTTSATLNVNGLGVKNIYINVNSPVFPGTFRTGQIVSVVYDGASFQLFTDIKIGSLTSLTTGNKTTVVDAINEVDSDLSTHKLASATTSTRGHVQLSSSLNSTATNLAATASTVKTVNDNLNTHAGTSATTSTRGHVQLSPSLTSPANNLAATASAVKTVNDNLNTHAGTSATTSAKGHVQLSSSLNSSSTTLAATASAVKSLKDDLDLVDNTVTSHLAESAKKHTGDVISNQHGSYVRFDNGLMICFAVTGGIPLPANGVATHTITLPNEFKDTSYTAVITEINTNGDISHINAMLRSSDKSKGSITARIRNSYSSDLATQINLMAVGMWK